MSTRPAFLAVIVVLVIGTGACSAPPADSATLGASPDSTLPVPASAAPSSAPATSPPESQVAATEPAAPEIDDPLLVRELTDVRTGETFTLAELAADAPVIVETMAIWCTNCRAQMHAVTAAHDMADFHSVSIDVESSEIAEDLVSYAEREGFDWPFVLADAELATQLRERFGNEILFPPGMPKLLVRSDGSIELLPLGDLLSAEEIAALVGG